MSRNIGIGEVRTKLLETDHKQWNCGMGLYDPNKVFFKEDPNGKVIVDGKLCSIVRSKSDSNLVMIGGKFYKFVQIDDQVWLAENLDLPFANATYYNDDPAQSYGLLYRGAEMGDLNDYLLENNVGWHVPTESELQTLWKIAGGGPMDGAPLKSTTSWNTTPGTNALGFDAKAAGMLAAGNYQYKGAYFIAWSCSKDVSNTNNMIRLTIQDTNNTIYTNGVGATNSVSVRLIKDTAPVEIDGKIYHTAKIGSQIWTIENLDWVAPGMAYNVTTIPDTPSVWYYNYADEEPKEHAGALYNAYAAKYINDNNLIPGWHVPCYGEVQELISHIGGTTGGGVKLRNFTGWVSESSPATNNYRFNAIPAGNRSTTPAFVNLSNYALFYTETIDGTDAYRLNINETKDIAFGKTTAKNGLSIRLVKDTEPVEIGGRKYKTTKIGNQLWMTENLDYIFEGLNVGGATLQSDVHAWYFNNDSEQSEGLLYNGYAAKYLAEHPELLPEGWKVPESSDFGVLQVAVGGANTAGLHLKNPGTMNGINSYRFNGLPTGMIRSNGSFTDRNTYLRLWTPNMSQSDATAQQFLTLESDKATATVVSFANDQTVAYSIRLVKNLSDGNSLSKGLLSTVIEDEGKEDIDEKPIEDEKKTEEVIEEKETIKEENKR